MRKIGPFILGALALAVSTAVPATAAPTLIGDTLTFQLLDDGIGLGSPLTHIETIIAAGGGIDEGDASTIGNVMLPGEYIHVFSQSVEFSLFGGSLTFLPPPNDSYQTTGFGTDARYVLSGLFEPGVSEITGVTIGLTDAVNVALGSQVLFDAHSVTLKLGDLGILTSGTNLGRVRLDFTVRELEEPPPPVPEPATLALVGSGLAAVWFRRRGASGRDAISRN